MCIHSFIYNFIILTILPAMHQPENRYVLNLLVKVYNCAITDYFYFPDVIYAGNQKIERADFELLVSEKLIALSKFDSFGRYYTLSKKGDHLLHQHFSKPVKKKPVSVPLTQGCLYFNRMPSRQANGARCLLFL